MPSTRPLFTLAIAALATSMVLACGPPTAAALDPVVIPLDVRDQSTSELLEADATEIAKTASTIVTVKHGSNDVECPVTLQVQKRDRIEGVPMTIQTEADFKALFADVQSPVQTTPSPTPAGPPELRHVRVVKSIRWCITDETRVAGCAIGLNVAVTRRDSDREGVLWAHEIGHTRTLTDRYGPDDWTAVMFKKILPEHFDVNVTECELYRK